MSGIWNVRGDVSEREELLDGRFHVVLEGRAGVLAVTCTLVWLLGREGNVPLSEGYLTMEASANGELNASLETGRLSDTAETGAVVVFARFIVDAMDGELAVLGDFLECELEVGLETWSGEICLRGKSTEIGSEL